MSEYEGYSFVYHHKFKKEFNKILKRHQCPSLKQDFKLLIQTLILNLTENQRFSEHICKHIVGLDDSVKFPAFIVKKFRCKRINQGHNSGFRITFLFDCEEKRFIFVEIYKRILKKSRIKTGLMIYSVNL